MYFISSLALDVPGLGDGGRVLGVGRPQVEVVRALGDDQRHHGLVDRPEDAA